VVEQRSAFGRGHVQASVGAKHELEALLVHDGVVPAAQEYEAASTSLVSRHGGPGKSSSDLCANQ
jgi:hypothetical protein